MCKRISFLIFALLLIAFTGCKKEPAKFCWRVMDNFGNEVENVCNKTEAQMQALYPGSCSYYKTGGENFCWLINGNFLRDMPEEKAQLLARCYYNNAVPVKTDCNYCGTWHHREKRTYKPNNTVTYSSVTRQTFCGDTAKTIFQGRQVVIRETADSIIVRQFSNNGTSW